MQMHYLSNFFQLKFVLPTIPCLPQFPLLCSVNEFLEINVIKCLMLQISFVSSFSLFSFLSAYYFCSVMKKYILSTKEENWGELISDVVLIKCYSFYRITQTREQLNHPFHLMVEGLNCQVINGQNLHDVLIADMISLHFHF